MWLLRSLLIFAITANRQVEGGAFYTGVRYPWAIKPKPWCFNTTLCPNEANYKWPSYFDEVLSMGAHNFFFGGYTIIKNELALDPIFYPPWNKSGFSRLANAVRSRGGKIIATLDSYRDKIFNETALNKSITNFLNDYSVDGFSFQLSPYLAPLENITNLAKVYQFMKAAGLETHLTFASYDWQRVKKTGLVKYADFVKVTIYPVFGGDAKTFNTVPFAKQVIINATKAGVAFNKLIIEVPLIGRATYPSSDIGYSSAIYDLHADPKGKGSIIYNTTTGSGYYFFSQPRAIKIVELAARTGLRGVALSPGGSMNLEDLYPWDKDSLFYAMAKAAHGKRLQ